MRLLSVMFLNSDVYINLSYVSPERISEINSTPAVISTQLWKRKARYLIYCARLVSGITIIWFVVITIWSFPYSCHITGFNAKSNTMSATSEAGTAKI